MQPYIDILAASDDGGGSTLKIILGLVFAGVWVLAQILAAIGKKKDKSRPPELDQPTHPPDMNPPARMPQQTPTPQDRPHPHSVPQRGQHLPQQHRQNPRPQYQQRTTTIQTDQPRGTPNTFQQKKPPALRKPRPQPTRPVPDPVPVVPDSSPILAHAVGAANSDNGPTPSQKLQAILRPANLKKEYILTEILQPPVSQRQDRFQ